MHRRYYRIAGELRKEFHILFEQAFDFVLVKAACVEVCEACKLTHFHMWTINFCLQVEEIFSVMKQLLKVVAEKVRA